MMFVGGLQITPPTIQQDKRYQSPRQRLGTVVIPECNVTSKLSLDDVTCQIITYQRGLMSIHTQAVLVAQVDCTSWF